MPIPTEDRPPPTPTSSTHGLACLPMSSARLAITSLVCLFAFAALALVVAHGSGPYGFEDPAIDWLGHPSAVRTWANVAELLGAPVLVVVFVVCFAFGLARQAVLRIALYAGLGIGAILISEHIAKPLVQRTYFSELTFPSGHVTAASATAAAMWLALHPLLEQRARHRLADSRLGLGPADVVGRGRRAMAHPT